ncbi:MAG: CBS domain-containing protein [Methylococcales bacterium]|nr:CBS domain-containing protein [Methylococcales bacterium]
MSVGEYCNRDVVIVNKTDSVQEAIGLMRSEHVGTVVVVEQINDSVVPVGVLTDRDVIVEVFAENVDLQSVNVGDVMSIDLVVVNESVDLMAAIKIMRSKGVRRIPVVNDDGALVGILSVDDVLDLLAEQMMDLAKLISKEQSREQAKTV